MLVITGSTVSGNSCTLNGVVVLSPSGSLTIANSIVAGNSCATTDAGNANYSGANAASSVNVTVASLDFTLIGPGTTYQTVIPGGSVSFTYQIAPLYGVYPDAVTFAVSGLPPGATYSLSGNHFAPNAGPQTIP